MPVVFEELVLLEANIITTRVYRRDHYMLTFYAKRECHHGFSNYTSQQVWGVWGGLVVWQGQQIWWIIFEEFDGLHMFYWQQRFEKMVKSS